MKWNESFFEINYPDKTVKFSVVHNLPMKGNVNSIFAAFDCWLARTKKYTQQDFIDYINSKGVYKAMTRQEYDDDPFLDLPSRSWKDDPPTDKQKETIENLQLALNQKIKIPKTKGECGELISQLIEEMNDDSYPDYGDMEY